MTPAGRLSIFFAALLWGPALLAGTVVYEGWKLESESDGIKVYSKAVEGSQFRQVKAITEVNASFESVVGILTDYENYKRWMHNITDSKVINQESDTVHYVYQYEDAPWPVQNRFCVARMTLIREKDEATLEFESVPRYMESRRDAIEFAHHKGHWKVHRNKSGCEVEYFIESNPGGFVPSWLVNQMAYGGPASTMHNLRDLAEHPGRT